MGKGQEGKTTRESLIESRNTDYLWTSMICAFTLATLGNQRFLLIYPLLRNVSAYYIFKSSYVIDMDSLEQSFTSCHEGPEERRLCQWEGFQFGPRRNS